MHRPVFINLAEEIPQPKLALIKIILQNTTRQMTLQLKTEHSYYDVNLTLPVNITFIVYLTIMFVIFARFYTVTTVL